MNGAVPLLNGTRGMGGEEQKNKPSGSRKHFYEY